MSKLSRVKYTFNATAAGSEYILKIDGEEYKEVWKKEGGEEICKYPIVNLLNDNNSLSDKFISLFEEMQNDLDRASDIIQEMEEELYIFNHEKKVY